MGSFTRTPLTITYKITNNLFPRSKKVHFLKWFHQHEVTRPTSHAENRTLLEADALPVDNVAVALSVPAIEAQLLHCLQVSRGLFVCLGLKSKKK